MYEGMVLQAIARGNWAGPGGPRGSETIGQVHGPPVASNTLARSLLTCSAA